MNFPVSRPASIDDLPSLIAGIIALVCNWAVAGEIAIDQIPEEVRIFVESGTLPIALEKADLNGDGREDFIMVLEPLRSDPTVLNEARRPLLILVRESDDRLKLAKRNDRIVYCAACGGVMGDPFLGVEVGLKTFEVSHY
ncbi:MAG: hypothetical protein ACRERV_16445, partial [Methylococcales bacterium]